MQNWEYVHAIYDGRIIAPHTEMSDVSTAGSVVRFLEEAREKGWEMCGAIPYPPSQEPDGILVIIFKRPKAEYRLFDQPKTKASGKSFPLLGWEKDHLRGCKDCQELSAAFGRFHKRMPLRLFGNGEMSQQSGSYKNVCCGIETFVAAGKPFPDCRRHGNLPTSWKLIDEEQEAMKKKSA
jgi:hypothetical protein